LLAFQSLRATSKYLDPDRLGCSFEIFGYDFMVTDSYKVYLIEVNSNPCLDTNQDPVMQKLIPHMLDSAFRIAIDPVFPSSRTNIKRQIEVRTNLFKLIYDESKI